VAKPFLKPLVALTIASAITSVTLLASANTTFAQVNFGESVVLPDAPIPASIVIDPSIPSNLPPSDAPTAGAPTAGAPTAGAPTAGATRTPPKTSIAPKGSVELGTGGAADAHEVALVSLALRQLALAKDPMGARQVASEINATSYKWSAKEMSCLGTLWDRESHWNFKAYNLRSGATGIPQALPASKMSVVAADWRTNPITQIKWGLLYIKLRYGTPCKALSHSNWSGNY
jgi:hypothetical protein